MAHLTRAQKAKRATRAMPDEDPEFQIAPMIDILLVLLVFFMSIATDQVLQVNKEVLLPIAMKLEQEKGDATKSEVFVNVLWTLDNNGRIEVDGKGAMEHDALTAYIKVKKENADKAGLADFRVIIRADRRAKYQYVRTVMAAIGNAAVPSVIFSAVDKDLKK